MDRSSNRVVAAALALILTAGVVYSGPARGSTAVAPTPRSAVGVDLGLSAHLPDATSGLILARARVLDPLAGAFLQRDPYGYQDSVNLYAYGANDPINHRDPTGEFIPLAYAIGVGVAVAAGLIFPHGLEQREAEHLAVDSVGALSGAVAGPVAGRIASPLLGAMIGGGAAGGAGAIATRGVKDAFAGEVSSPSTYAVDAAIGLGLGATVGGVLQGASTGISRVRSSLDFEGTFDRGLRGAFQEAAAEQEAALAASFKTQPGAAPQVEFELLPEIFHHYPASSRTLSRLLRLGNWAGGKPVRSTEEDWAQRFERTTVASQKAERV